MKRKWIKERRKEGREAWSGEAGSKEKGWESGRERIWLNKFRALTGKFYFTANVGYVL